MTEGDVVRLMAAMKGMWPHAKHADENDPMVRETWLLLLGPYAIEQALSALMTHRSDGFPPTVGQIAEDLDPKPTLEQLRSDMDRVNHEVEGGLNYGRPEAEAFSNPVIAVWAMQDDYRRMREYGISPDQAELPTDYGVWQAGLRKDLDAFCRRVDPPTARRMLAEMEQPKLDAGEAPAELTP